MHVQLPTDNALWVAHELAKMARRSLCNCYMKRVLVKFIPLLVNDDYLIKRDVDVKKKGKSYLYIYIFCTFASSTLSLINSISSE